MEYYITYIFKPKPEIKSCHCHSNYNVNNDIILFSGIELLICAGFLCSISIISKKKISIERYILKNYKHKYVYIALTL